MINHYYGITILYIDAPHNIVFGVIFVGCTNHYYGITILYIDAPHNIVFGVIFCWLYIQVGHVL